MSQASSQTRSDGREQNAQRHQRSPAEWLTFGVAALIVLLIAGLVVYDWISAPSSPPVIELTQSEEIRAEGGQFYVPFTVTNSGGDTAEAVQLIAELSVDGEVVEDGEQQIDFLAGKETQEGAFVFSQDPRQGELTLRVGSYQEP
jgi:uncharacterized protein (TIGR02588 family)